MYFITYIVYIQVHVYINALTVQNPRHKCDWETRMTAGKKIIADCTNDYYTYVCVCVCYNLHSSPSLVPAQCCSRRSK